MLIEIMIVLRFGISSILSLSQHFNIFNQDSEISPISPPSMSSVQSIQFVFKGMQIAGSHTEALVNEAGGPRTDMHFCWNAMQSWLRFLKWG